MKREHKFELIEHTADVGIIGFGGTKAEAFEAVAFGMFSIVADLEEYEPTRTVQVFAAGDDDLSLLERFLSSLLVLFDGDAMLPLDFEIVEMSDYKLTCNVWCREIDEDIEWIGPTVKAVTYHMMQVDEVAGVWRAQAIFDV